MTEQGPLADQLFSSAVGIMSANRTAALLSAMLGSLRKSLTGDGFTREEAVQLCNTWLFAFVQGQEMKRESE